MRGRQPGKPTKWVRAHVHERIDLAGRGVKFEVWQRYKRGPRKIGTLQVTIFGLRWWVGNGRRPRRATWNDFAKWMDS